MEQQNEKKKEQQKLIIALLLFIIGAGLLAVCHFYLTPKYDELKDDIAQTAILARKISSVVEEGNNYVIQVKESGKEYGNLVANKDSYISFLGDITMQNQLNINKMTVGDITSAGSDMYSMKVQIELQGDLFNVKNLVQQLYASDIVSRINKFSYRLQSEDNLQWMWRNVDDENLVPWWDLEEEKDTASASKDEKVLGADDLMQHGTALCYLEVEFLGNGG